MKDERHPTCGLESESNAVRSGERRTRYHGATKPFGLFCCLFIYIAIDSAKNLLGATVALGRDKFNETDFNPTALNDTCGTVNLDFTYARTASIFCDR